MFLVLRTLLTSLLQEQRFAFGHAHTKIVGDDASDEIDDFVFGAIPSDA